MERFISRVVFWIVTLLGLQAKSLPIIDITESNIQLMRDSVKCVEGSTFYTPSNIEENCIAAALDCFFRELSGNATADCDDSGQYIGGAIEFLLNKMQELNSYNNTTASQCSCESWPEAPFNTFLDGMERLYQRLNSIDRT